MIQSHSSIQNRLMVSLTITIIVLFGISAIGLYFFMRRAFYEQSDRNLVRVAEDFIHETERTPDGELECEFHELNIGEFRGGSSEGGAYYELRDHRGESLIRSASLGKDENLPYHPVAIGIFETKPIPLKGKVSGRVIFTSFALELEGYDSDDQETVIDMSSLTPTQKAFVKSYDKNDPENRVYLAIAEKSEDLHQTLLILASALFVIGIILAGTTFLLVRSIVLSACRPIVKIAQITEQIGPNDLNTAHLPVEAVPIELLPLIVKFNEFIERLDEAITRERRFSTDLAHEIRTPVAEIRSLMEVTASSVKNGSNDDPYEIYQRGAAISKRLSKIIEVITAIYQEDPEALHLASEPVSVRAILKQSIDGFDSQTQLRFHLEDKNPDGTSTKTDPDLLRAIVDNLLTNSVAHSPANSEIMVTCHESGFSVHNTATDLEKSDLPLLTGAFWQKDSARTDSDRFGLGLTLVATYLRLLNGHIEHSLNDGKLTATVLLPGKES